MMNGLLPKKEMYENKNGRPTQIRDRVQAPPTLSTDESTTVELPLPSVAKSLLIPEYPSANSPPRYVDPVEFLSDISPVDKRSIASPPPLSPPRWKTKFQDDVFNSSLQLFCHSPHNEIHT